MKMLYDLALSGYNPKAGANDGRVNADYFGFSDPSQLWHGLNSCATPFAASSIFKMPKIARGLSIGHFKAGTIYDHTQRDRAAGELQSVDCAPGR